MLEHRRNRLTKVVASDTQVSEVVSQDPHQMPQQAAKASTREAASAHTEVVPQVLQQMLRPRPSHSTKEVVSEDSTAKSLSL